jgi:hypothetical protein
MTIEKVTVDGKEVDAAKFLAALHNHTSAVGMGVLHDIGRSLTVGEARADLSEMKRFSFDYYRGRPLKVSADDNGVVYEFARDLFDRDAGKGQFDRALAEALR